MYGHGGKLSLHTFYGNAVFLAKFILQSFMYIADTDFPEEVGAAVIVGQKNLLRLFRGHAYAVIRDIDADVAVFL